MSSLYLSDADSPALSSSSNRRHTTAAATSGPHLSFLEQLEDSGSEVCSDDNGYISDGCCSGASFSDDCYYGSSVADSDCDDAPLEGYESEGSDKPPPSYRCSWGGSSYDTISSDGDSYAVQSQHSSRCVDESAGEDEAQSTFNGHSHSLVEDSASEDGEAEGRDYTPEVEGDSASEGSYHSVEDDSLWECSVELESNKPAKSATVLQPSDSSLQHATAPTFSLNNVPAVHAEVKAEAGLASEDNMTIANVRAPAECPIADAPRTYDSKVLNIEPEVKLPEASSAPTVEARPRRTYKVRRALPPGFGSGSRYYCCDYFSRCCCCCY